MKLSRDQSGRLIYPAPVLFGSSVPSVALLHRARVLLERADILGSKLGLLMELGNLVFLRDHMLIVYSFGRRLLWTNTLFRNAPCTLVLSSSSQREDIIVSNQLISSANDATSSDLPAHAVRDCDSATSIS
jgi:hypothetical protein